jgi:hypothetical protein
LIRNFEDHQDESALLRDRIDTLRINREGILQQTQRLTMTMTQARRAAGSSTL